MMMMMLFLLPACHLAMRRGATPSNDLGDGMLVLLNCGARLPTDAELLALRDLAPEIARNLAERRHAALMGRHPWARMSAHTTSTASVSPKTSISGRLGLAG